MFMMNVGSMHMSMAVIVSMCMTVQVLKCMSVVCTSERTTRTLNEQA